MTKWTSVAFDDVPSRLKYPVERSVSGLVGARLLSPPDFSLWLCIAEFGTGGSLEWSGVHSDDAVYVLDGLVEVDGRRVEKGGAVLAEHAATAMLHVLAPSTLAHFGSRVNGPAVDGPFGRPIEPMDAVHTVGPEGAWLSGSRETSMLSGLPTAPVTIAVCSSSR